MVFSSVTFLLLFLPVVLAFYFLPIPNPRYKNAVLLLASLAFYLFGSGWYFFVLIFTIVANYSFGVILSQKKSVAWIIAAVTTNLLVLFTFKYLDFAVLNVTSVANILFSELPVVNLGIALPIGISFFVFQGISYCVDIYRGKIEYQNGLLRYALYKSFFPQLIAGPIVRYSTIQSKISHRPVNLKQITDGARRFSIGLGKKVLVADTLAITADRAFSVGAADLTTPVAWIALFCYSGQLYFDFSGYSDMAIGLAKIFGFEFDENFDHPYRSNSVTEFWRRWHISLSTWFRDYVYIPLGGSRVGTTRSYLNLSIVFLLCGIWHGANWTFLIWGLYHGAFLVMERRFGWVSKELSKPSLWRTATTFIAISLGWVLFRSPNLEVASIYAQALFGFRLESLTSIYQLSYFIDLKGWVVLLAALGVEVFGAAKLLTKIPLVMSEWFKLAFAFLVLLLSLASVAGATFSPFIYFQF